MVRDPWVVSSPSELLVMFALSGELDDEIRWCHPKHLLVHLDLAQLDDAIAMAIPVGSSSPARTASPDAKDQDPSSSSP